MRGKRAVIGMRSSYSPCVAGWRVYCVEHEAIRTTRKERETKSRRARDSGRSDVEVRSVPSVALCSPLHLTGRALARKVTCARESVVQYDIPICCMLTSPLDEAER